MIPKRKHGDYFSMNWDDGPADYHAVKGHLEPLEFIGTLEEELGDADWGFRLGKEDLVNYGPQKQLYARWGFMNCGGEWPEGEPVQTLYFFEKMDRGCFPVTVTFRTNK